jgi:Proton-conducting membrane transporter
VTALMHPALPLFLAALLVPLARGRGRGLAALGGAILALVAVLALPEQGTLRLGLLGLDLELIRLDALSRVFALVLGIVTVLGTLYAAHLTRAGEHAAALVYAGSSLGVVLAGDWVSLFLFWELMAVSSAALVWFGGEPRSRAAGLRYILVHVAGGSLLFAGIVVGLAAGAREVGPVPPGWAFGLILVGIGLNAAVPPLHAWLTDAYPEASVTGTVFLSAFTTKTAVYVLIRAFPGATVLAWAGVVMALYGVVFAVLENDIRRLLAYHIVSQVGYMVAGVGMGTALALNGATAALCVWLGVQPSWLYARLPFTAGYAPYTVDHVVSALQLLIGTGVAFWLLRGALGGEPTVSLDTDWVYRGPLLRATLGLVGAARLGGEALNAATARQVSRAARLARNPYRLLGGWSRRLLGEAGTPEIDYDEDRHRLPIGVTLFWIAVALGLVTLLGG